MKLASLAFAAIASVSLGAVAAGAQDYKLGDYSLNFAAPVVLSTSTLTDNQIGTIVFDSNDRVFKGYDSAGNWAPMTAPSGAATVVSGGNERVERARITGGTCLPSSQSGTWIASSSHSTTGQCTLNFAAGVFSAAPSCTCTPQVSGAFCYFTSGATTAGVATDTRFVNLTPTAGDVDLTFDIICMGPR